MNRISTQELSFGRVYDAVWRRLRDLPNAIAWNVNSGISEVNRSRLARYSDRHKGQRCFIMGNGPSLGNMDLSKLSDEITFGLNRIYLLFDKLPFIPTYYVSINDLVLEQFAHEISVLKMQKFINWNCKSFYNFSDPSVAFIRISIALGDKFNRQITRPFYSGGTVTYVAIQLAFIMGFSEIYLIGVDHSFADKGTPNKIETRVSDVDENHFAPDYFPKGVKWQLPDLLRSEIAYGIARGEIEKGGRHILDATAGGKLTVFEKVNFEELF